jgi:plasmid stability protein
MAKLTIRNLDDTIIQRLEKIAKQRGQSLEAEVRDILTRAAGKPTLDEFREHADRIAAMTPKGVKQTDSTQIIRDERDLHGIVKEIGCDMKSVGRADPPDRPAVYGIFANEPDCLPAVQFRRADFLYLGKSKKPINRGHFETGKTSSSTLRRTLGAILKQQLGIRAYARGRGLLDADFERYRFDEIGEEKLTNWMNANLQIGFSIVVDDIDETESRLIRYCEPVLNLMRWSNPQAERIKALRKICAYEARTNGPLRHR